MDTVKQIDIAGTANRYMMKKVLKVPVVIKKRDVCQTWDFPRDDQLKLINDLDETNADGASIAIFRELNKKLAGYKQQDLKKGIHDENKFVELADIVDKMRESLLRCRYCSTEMLVLYDISREMTQWTVDRIDNDEGHNKDNYHLACLKCNLKRRRTSDDKFLLSSTFSTFLKGGAKSDRKCSL